MAAVVTQHAIDKVKVLLHDERVKSAIDVVKILMTFAEQQKGLTGPEKSALVKTLLSEQSLFDDLPVPLRIAMDLMIDNDLVQPTIDLACDASKGKLNVNQVITCCIPFVGAIVNAIGRKREDTYKEKM